MRTAIARQRFQAFRVGWVEVACAVEPPLLLVVTWLFQRRLLPAAAVTPGAISAALVGAALVILAWAIYAWTFASWPTLFVGHGVLTNHRLVTRGAYGFVRHPAYLAAFLVWLSLAVGFRSGTALAITVLYVIPIYLLYIRSEERMLAEYFGDQYRDYRCTVPMLVPRSVAQPISPARHVTRDVAPSAVEDLLDHPPRATVAFVDRDSVDLLPANARCTADTYGFGISADGAPNLADREVVLVIDDGPYWFELRGISVRGIARPIDAPAAAAAGLVWYAIEPGRVLAWDYGAIREE